MQYCMSSVFGFESSRDPQVIYVKERIIETPSPPPSSRTCFSPRNREKSYHDWKRNAGGCGGGVRNVAWVTGRRCTREQSALPQSRGTDRAVSRLPFPSERKRTFAVRALGQWCARKGRLAFRFFSRHRIKGVAGFLIWERARALTLSRMQAISSSQIRFNSLFRCVIIYFFAFILLFITHSGLC